MPDRFGVSGVIGVGNTITLTFTNTALANTTQAVVIKNLEGQSVAVEFAMNSEGVGTLNWIVPAWDLFVLTHSTSQDHTTVIP